MPPPAWLPRQRRAVDAARVADYGLDLVVVVLAAGTVAYHAALVFDLRRLVLACLWAIVTAAGVVLIGRVSTVAAALEERPASPAAVGIASGLALAAAGALYLLPDSDHWWWAFTACAVAALSVGAASAFRRRGWRARVYDVGSSAVPFGVVVALAVGLGVASLVTNRPDLDDVYVVNRSVYVEEHAGQVPEQDTLFSNQEHAGQRAPLRSPAFEVLAGVVAAALPVDAATVLYLGVAPVASMLAVLAMWRLVRVLRCSRPLVALVGATLFVLLDGSVHAAFGNLSFARAWQGKVVLTAVLVPLLWHHAVRWARDGSRRDLVLLAAANIAAAGLSSTGLFVAPMATGAVALGFWPSVRSPTRVLAAALATAYPTALALLNRASDAGLDTQAPAAGGELAPWWRWLLVFGRPALALSAVALCLGWAASRDRATRVALAIVPAIVVVSLYGPHVLDPLRTLAPGASAILWRAIWVIPVPVMAGMVLTVPWAVRSRNRVGVVGATAAVVLAVGMFTTTTPVMSERNNASVGWPTWKTGGNVEVAERLVAEAPAGTLVAGPFEVDRVVPLVSSERRAVNPRPGWYAPGVDPSPRELVQRALTSGVSHADTGALAVALDTLAVRVVAVPTRLRHDDVMRVLRERSFVLVGVEGQYLILKRRP